MPVRVHRSLCRNIILLLLALIFAIQSSVAHAGQIRLWSTAVVVADTIKLRDLAELRDMDSSEEEDSLRNIIITDAPPPGGSRIIRHEMVRAALSAKGINFARVSLSGSAQCEVRKPAAPQQSIRTLSSPSDPTSKIIQNDAADTAEKIPQSTQTLRDFIEDHFNKEFARYGGRAEILIDHSNDALLDLTGPAFEFRIQREKNTPLGLCALKIDVMKDGKTAQQIPMVVRTSMTRNVLTAKRAINQGAAVVAADVGLMPVTFTRLDDLGVDDTSLVLGQRAKRFIPAGTKIGLDLLEPVPLVLRGQLITLISEVGGVRVVTTAKAGANGMRGETIRVRSVDDTKVEFDAVVTGPGEARAAGSSDKVLEESKPRLVLGVKP